MEDGNGGEEEISERDKNSTSHNVCSFGISIDTSEIASVAQQDRGDELHALDIDVYEQEELEGGILNQVDNALAAAESDFKRNIIRKQLAQLEDEKQLLERDLVDINKIFVSAKEGSGSASSKVSFSLLQQKQSKENALKRLEERVRDTKESLSQLDTTALLKGDDSVGESEDSIAESVRLGELTPFEALELQKKKITIPKFKSTPLFDHPKKLGKETTKKTNFLPFPSTARSPVNHVDKSGKEAINKSSCIPFPSIEDVETDDKVGLSDVVEDEENQLISDGIDYEKEEDKKNVFVSDNDEEEKEEEADEKTVLISDDNDQEGEDEESEEVEDEKSDNDSDYIPEEVEVKRIRRENGLDDFIKSDNDSDCIPDELGVKRVQRENGLEDLIKRAYAKKAEVTVKKVKKRKKIAKPVVATKKKKKKKKKKVVDDGDFKLFRERMAKMKVRAKLKAACKAGEVEDEYDSSDFSDVDDEDSPPEDVTVQDDFVLPKRIWDKLYSYQRVCVKWLWQLHKQQAGGIVGDEMGLGKTVEVIAFLAGLKHSATKNKKKFDIGAVLVVCPATVMQHWVQELRIWWPKFRAAILHESGSFGGRKETLIKAINNHPGVLITSYDGVRINQKDLHRYHWDYVILDEGHKIRNPNCNVTHACKKFDTAHRILMTGTPMQNNLQELWSLFDFVFPGRLGTLPVFMTEFSIPITKGGYATASSIEVQTAYRCASVLRDTINPYLLRRLKKDVGQAVKLPPKSEQVLFCKLTEEQKQLYKDYCTSRDVSMILTGQLKVFVGLIKLRHLCNHPDLVSEDDSHPMLHGEDKVQGQVKRSGKMIVVDSLLKMWKQQEHRVLLFTQSKKMLDILEKYIRSTKYKYLRLDGGSSIAGRQTLVKKFNEDESIFIFILTTRVGGLGLNLIGANRVIIYDPDWNPSTDIQARERSWRIGQEKDVTIYRLMTVGTVEEKIYHRQIFKQFLTNRVLTNPFQRLFFKANDLFELFTFEDVGPKQLSETSSIFSGTGSNINIKQLKNNKNKTKKAGGKGAENLKTEPKRTEPKKLSRTVKRCELSSEELSSDDDEDVTVEQVVKKVQERRLANDLKRKSMNVELPDQTHRKKKKSTGAEEEMTTKKKKKKKDKEKKKRKNEKVVSIDGMAVKNVAKSEVFKPSKEKEEDKEKDGKDDIKTEDDVLLSLFKSSGIHSALKHDNIERADKDDFLFVEREAQRNATDAIDRLKRSGEDCRRQNGLTVPTWTGKGKGNNKDDKEGGCKPKKKPRFGKPEFKASAAPKKPIKTNTAKSGVDISSSALLQRMKNRHGAILSSNSTNFSGATSAEPEADSVTGVRASECNTADPSGLAKDIQQYLAQCQNRCASSDALTMFFKSRIGVGNNVLFKEILKRLCTFKKLRADGSGLWTLKEEFS